MCISYLSRVYYVTQNWKLVSQKFGNHKNVTNFTFQSFLFKNQSFQNSWQSLYLKIIVCVCDLGMIWSPHDRDKNLKRFIGITWAWLWVWVQLNYSQGTLILKNTQDLGCPDYNSAEFRLTDRNNWSHGPPY